MIHLTVAELTVAEPRRIKTTTSLCPACRAQVPAEVVERDGAVWLDKTCPEHGRFQVKINSDRRWYFQSTGQHDGGCGGGACCAPAGHDPTLVERSSTCIALIEIVQSCNLACPTCFADSPHTGPENIDALTFEEFKRRVEAVIARKGMIDILQLSGGEPTIHPRFFELMAWSLAHPQIGYVLLNTNGVRLAGEDDFMRRLGDLGRAHRGASGLGLFEVYLQFDGPQEAGQRELRAADLRQLRSRVIERCAAERIAVNLAMTVNRANLPHLGDTLRLALAHENVRGVTFQPEFTSGRSPVAMVPLSVHGAAAGPRVHDSALNVADLIAALVGQSDGLLTDRDFTPLPCGDPNCHTTGYLLRRNGEVHRVSDHVDFATMHGFLKDRVNFDLDDLARCGCESEELGAVLKALEIGPDHVLRLFIKPFMDAWTYDQHRVDRCCVHVIGEGGSLESFCRHYAMRGG